MKFSPEQLAKAKTANSAEELIALAKENGIEMTEEEANKYFADFHKEGELSDDELDNVTGGCGGKNEEMAQTEPPHDPKYKVGDTVWYNRDWYTVGEAAWDESESSWRYCITRSNWYRSERTWAFEYELLDHVPKKYM